MSDILMEVVGKLVKDMNDKINHFYETDLRIRCDRLFFNSSDKNRFTPDLVDFVKVLKKSRSIVHRLFFFIDNYYFS